MITRTDHRVIPRRDRSATAQPKRHCEEPGPRTTPSKRADDDVSVAFDWHAVGEVELTPKGGLAFPKLPAVPGLYRFPLVGPDRTTVYVGAAAFLTQRIERYRYGYHRQGTNARMNRRMKEHLTAGGSIELSIASRLQ